MDIGFTTTPLGCVKIEGNNGLITKISYQDELSSSLQLPKATYIENCILQLNQYLSRFLKHFDVPIAPSGTSFYQDVWQALCNVPYGTTTSYKDIAYKIGSPKGFRAVGQANNRNPIPIIIPCHRVLASNGNLTGYAGGLWRKQWLLELERR